MAIKRTLDRSAVMRFTGIDAVTLRKRLEREVYREKFPINFTRELVREIWRARHVPDVKRPRLKMHDVYAALGISYATLRKYLADGALGRVRYDISGNIVLSLEQFFFVALKTGRREWVPDDHPVTRPER